MKPPQKLDEEIKCRCYFVHTDDNKLEFVTQQDEWVCDECTEFDGKTFTKEEAANIIPLH